MEQLQLVTIGKQVTKNWNLMVALYRDFQALVEV